ncbi:hypothetical protein LMG23994_01326 [Cupriavidus pinatubonensis]|uniref:Lysozyme inhibitor LprI N-terminal domain-containing protein n=1 Tax=Cupriavidus pinatubonensis TaxID=248026 RepID=A0ABN7Y6N3_9BURK|nr:hypothetical protein LMG23994_01326 [Cupriavidus pinatubonensis]
MTFFRVASLLSVALLGFSSQAWGIDDNYQSSSLATAAPSVVDTLICESTSPVCHRVVTVPRRPPSFDCNKARTRVEQLICADEGLSAADRLLAMRYKAAIATAPDKMAFKRYQDTWRETQRDPCRDVACVREAYAQRNEELADLAVGQRDAPNSEKRPGMTSGLKAFQAMFFAYTVDRDEGSFVYLSHDPCTVDEAGKSGWKSAMYSDGKIVPSDACWKPIGANGHNGEITFCKVTRSGLGNVCVLHQLSNFRSTASLERLPFSR